MTVTYSDLVYGDQVHLHLTSDYKKVLELDPSQPTARQAIVVSMLPVTWRPLAFWSVKQSSSGVSSFSGPLQYLPEKIKEQQEKLKAEMLGEVQTIIIIWIV